MESHHLRTLSKWLLMSLFAISAAVSPLEAQDASKLPFPSAAAVDSHGFIYLVGDTQFRDVTTTQGVFQPALPPGACTNTCAHGFIAKIGPTGDTVAWATYLAGTGRDTVRTAAIARDDSLYVAGTTTSTTLTSPSGNPSGNPRAFVARVSPDGKSLLAATYFGGSGTDTVTKIVLDAAGNMYISGTTSSTDFPTTSGAYQRTIGAGSASATCNGPTDQFVVKFDPALKTLLFSTLIGTPEAERTDDFAIGPDGSLYIAGTRGRERDCLPRSILTRLNPQGSSAMYSIERGGPGGGYTVAVDATGTAYLGSDTRTYGFASPQGWIYKLDPQGKGLLTAGMNGLIVSLTAGASDVGVLGSSWPGNLTTTATGPRPCYPPLHYEQTQVPYLARLNLTTLAPTYLGYLTATEAWQVGSVQIVAQNPHSTLLPYALLPAGPPSPGTVNCIADAADYQSNAVAPGEIISLFGTQIGPSSPVLAQPDSDAHIGTELGGVHVRANGLSAPLLYAAPGQINFVVPFGLSGEKVHMELYSGTSLVAQFDKLLLPRHPGMFASGTPLIGQLAALNQDGSVNSATNPATAGSVISIFATGLGAMTPQLPDGAVPLLPMNTPVVLPRVQVNSQPADLLYAGNAPYLVEGVVQINLRLPNPIPPAALFPSGQAYVAIASPETGPDTGGVIAVR
jgi:uncharacterized protein (TIGR03437 family)